MIILLTILGFIISYLLYLLILKPLISLRFYQQQGCDMRFFAIKGQLKFNIDSLVKMGDFYGYWKQIVKDNPEIPAFGGNLRENTQLLLVDPALIKELYSKQHYYVKAPALINLYKYIAPYGISVLEGESWKRHRRLIGSAFHHDLLREMVPHIVKTSEKLCEEMKRDDLKAVDTTLQFEHISGEAIGGLFFGESFSEYQIKGKPLMAFLNELVGKLGSQLPTMMYLLFGINAIKSGILPIYRSINADRRELFEFATAVVEKKIEAAKLKAKDNKTLTNLIDILVKQSQGSSSSEDTFSPEEIVSEFITFLEAGKDNTAITLTNGLYYLHKNPQYKETLMKEINKYFQDASTVTLDDLNKMEFTGAFLKEAMRLSPSESGVAEKVALEDHTLGKLKIKKGTFVDIAVLSNNYNSKYHDDVDKFMPERWLDDCKTKESVGKDPYIYLPFSIGKRNCIGQHFAMIEMKIILSIFLKKFEFSLPDDYELKMTQRFFYVPLKTMYFKLTPKDIFIR